MEETTQPSLLNYLDELMRHLAAQVSAALLAGEVSAVHQSRVATRRMGAALKLIEGIVEKKSRKRLERSLKKMRKRLGALRDLDVMMDHLAELRVNSAQSRAIDWMQQQLSREREEAQTEAVQDIPLYKTLGQLEHWRLIRAEVEGAQGLIDSLLAQSLHDQMDAFASAANKIANPHTPEATAPDAVSFEGSGQEDQPDPHQVRIEGKALRYTLEMAEAAGHRLPTKVFKSFKSMQDALGTWHDYVVLTESIMKRSADNMLAHHDMPVQVEVLQLATHVLHIAQRELEKFNRHWREKGESLVSAVREAFPLTRDVSEQVLAESSITESKTDRDLAGSDESEDPAAPQSDESPDA